MAVFYRKYRSQKFSEVVGQKPITQTLQNAVLLSKPSHAYLFAGSRGVGKTSVARILAKALNCSNLEKNGDPCDKCDSCRTITAGSFLDLIEIDAASHTGVDHVRELIEHIKFKPSSGQYKVVIIDEVHMLSKSAFNALLKTLEEPPAHVVFIMATTDPEKVLPTIISRSQRFDFKPIRENEIVAHLQSIAQAENIDVSEEVLGLVAKQATGGMRDALSLFDKIASSGAKLDVASVGQLLGVTSFRVSSELFNRILQGDPAILPSYFDQLAEQGIDFIILSKDILEYCRKLLVLNVAGPFADIDVLEDELKILTEQSKQFSTTELMFLTRLYMRAMNETPSSPQADLPLLLSTIEAVLKVAKIQPIPASSIDQKSDRKPPFQQREKKAVIPKTETPKDEGVSISVTENFDTVAGNITLQEISLLWTQIVDLVKQENSPVATILRNSPVVSTSEGTIHINVRYLFHKEQLESTRNVQLIGKSISAITGKSLRLLVGLNKSSEEIMDAEQGAQSALQVFGGELID